MIAKQTFELREPIQDLYLSKLLSNFYIDAIIRNWNAFT